MQFKDWNRDRATAKEEQELVDEAITTALSAVKAMRGFGMSLKQLASITGFMYAMSCRVAGHEDDYIKEGIECMLTELDSKGKQA